MNNKKFRWNKNNLKKFFKVNKTKQNCDKRSNKLKSQTAQTTNNFNHIQYKLYVNDA